MSETNLYKFYKTLESFVWKTIKCFCVSVVKSSQQWVGNFKISKKSETADCLWRWEIDTMPSQVNASQTHDRQCSLWLQPLVDIIVGSLDNTHTDESNNYLREET